MKKKLTSNLNQYYRKIDSYIPKKYPHRKEIISSIHQDISSYLSEHPDADYEDILEHFGTPEEMTLSFAESLSSQEIMTTARKNKRHLIILLIIIIIGIGILSAMIYHVNWVAEHTIVEIEERTVIYPETTINEE